MTKIKLCGLSRIEDIEAANTLKPDFIGFVFAAKFLNVCIVPFLQFAVNDFKDLKNILVAKFDDKRNGPLFPWHIQQSSQVFLSDKSVTASCVDTAQDLFLRLTEFLIFCFLKLRQIHSVRDFNPLGFH